MARRSALPSNWDRHIPEDRWPDALIAAIRYDVQALSAQRVIDTLASWRQTASDGSPEERKLALERLKAVGDALILPAPSDEPTRALISDPAPAGPVVPTDFDEPDGGTGEQTVAAFQTGTGKRSGPPPPPPPSQVGPPAERSRIDEGPTQGLNALEMISEMIAAEDRAAEEEQEATRVERVPSSNEPPARSGSDGSKLTQFDYMSIVSNEFEEHERPTTAQPNPSQAQPPASTAVPRSRPPPPLNAPPSLEDPNAKTAPPDVSSRSSSPPSSRPSRPPPLPGRSVVRRTNRRIRTGGLPRASMVQVRPLKEKVLALARELVPLTYERRSRRFWARWREVAGERGVRRDVVEELLQTIEDERELTAHLIAEAHMVDPASVMALIDELDLKEGPQVS